ncbi:MAG TPA: hypothetical protein VHP83_19795 [Aggregatilineaceae bacterium]|nr:hypothetical protein [Aggregatilineaceae bacterium]
MKRLLVAFVLLASLLSLVPVSAQGDINLIAYGDVVTASLPAASAEVSYSFTGVTGDVVVITAQPADAGLYLTPSVYLLDASGVALGTSEGFAYITVAAVLPSDGVYTIKLSLPADATDVGDMTLQLIAAPKLVLDTPIQDTLTSEESRFYALEVTDAFGLSYERTAGEFGPAITVNSIGDDGSLSEEGALYGERLTKGNISLGIENVGTPTVYVVSLAPALFSFYFEEVSADYTLTLTAP